MPHEWAMCFTGPRDVLAYTWVLSLLMAPIFTLKSIVARSENYIGSTYEEGGGSTGVLGNLPCVHTCKGKISRMQLGDSVDLRALVGKDNVMKAIAPLCCVYCWAPRTWHSSWNTLIP